MEQLELKRLRKKQMLHVNLSFIPMAILFALTVLLELSAKPFFLILLAVIVVISAIECYLYFTKRYAFTEDMRKLAEYEQKKVGELAYRKERRGNVIASVFVILTMIFNYVIAVPNMGAIFAVPFIWVAIVLAPIILGLLNWSTASRAKRIDAGEPLRNVRRGNWKKGLLAALLVVIASLITTYFMIIMI
ncbi:hypothetical protein LCM20_09900 [Halobacillus litoralis]|uniref:hypothetical protein n=1 Tax=Halobacillus litoralis TaxID=45668 RepID=UPI001CD68975|nr:hypothetical protein [Halobacillus litoralis]MCA0970903.1 hypothetical protein [Halobacillus litoralis]